MNSAGNFFGSSIGRKILMAVTGLVLIGFVVGHLVGNLQVFSHPDKINGYAHFLQSLGPTLWIARIGLLVVVVIHIWAATMLALESKAARGPQPGKVIWLRATLSSRYMRWTGYVVLAFILYHLAHFTVGAVQGSTFKEALPPYTMVDDYHVLGFTTVRAGTEVLDVYRMVILGFQPPLVSLFYIVAVGLLSVHLLHGMDSLFQTLGWRNARWSRSLRVVVIVACAAYFIGNVAIPGSVLAGRLTLEPRVVAASQR